MYSSLTFSMRGRGKCECVDTFLSIFTLQPLEPGEVNELAKVTSVCGIPRTAECVSIMK